MNKFFLLGLLITIYAYPQGNISRAEFETSRNDHIAKVIFTIGAFNPSEHKIVGLDPNNHFTDFRIDGNYPLGTDWNLPTREIQEMRIVFDGININVPKY